MPIRTWARDWNDILRNRIFQDEELKRLMLLPENTNIVTFVDRYFVRAGYTNKLLSDEHVRIVYGDAGSFDTQVPNVKQNELSFDIYVKLDDLRNATNDRLLLRTNLIADRLIELLTSERYIGGYRFWVKGDWDMGTRTVGYARYNVSFYYMKVY